MLPENRVSSEHLEILLSQSFCNSDHDDFCGLSSNCVDLDIDDNTSNMFNINQPCSLISQNNSNCRDDDKLLFSESKTILTTTTTTTATTTSTSTSTMSSQQIQDNDKCSVKIHKYNKKRRRKKLENDDVVDCSNETVSLSSSSSSLLLLSSTLSDHLYSHSTSSSSSSSSHIHDGHDKISTNNNKQQNTSKVTRCNQNLNSLKISNCYKPILTISSWLTFISYCNFFLLTPIESCSSRSTPKPRLTSPTSRPNVTFQTYACPEAYAKWYCLNGATCFAVRIGESILYNCECTHGYMGQRCEFKDLEGSYLPSRDKFHLATASLSGEAAFALFFVVVLCVALIIRKDFLARRRRRGEISLVSAT